MPKHAGFRQILNRLVRRTLLMIPMISVSHTKAASAEDMNPKQSPTTPLQELDFDDILILAGAEGFPDRLH